MGDERKIHHSDESDADLERRLGTRIALFALWNPSGQPVGVSWDDSSIVTADNQTRSRLVQAHSVIHGMLCGQHADAMHRLATMTSLMASFTALRSLTLASELLWNVAVQTWQQVLAAARSQVLATVADDTSETVVGVDAIAEAIHRNLDGRRPSDDSGLRRTNGEHIVTLRPTRTRRLRGRCFSQDPLVRERGGSGPDHPLLDEVGVLRGAECRRPLRGLAGAGG